MMGRRDQDDYAAAAGAGAPGLDELQGLLEQQLERVRRGNLAGFDELSQRADTLIEHMAGADVIHSPAFLARRSLLERLYRQLSLTLAAQRQEAAHALHAVRRGKKTVRAYRTQNFRR